MDARIDQNKKSNMMGVSSVDGETPVPISVDPITGYLMVQVVDTDPTVFPVLRSDAKIDVNHKPTMTGVTNDAFQKPQCMVTHNGYLAVDII
jgi:hypothetical protein